MTQEVSRALPSSAGRDNGWTMPLGQCRQAHPLARSWPALYCLKLLAYNRVAYAKGGTATLSATLVLAGRGGLMFSVFLNVLLALTGGLMDGKYPGKAYQCLSHDTST